MAVSSRPEIPALAASDVQAEARALGLQLTPAQADALARFVDLLQRWSAVYNLTGIREPSAILSHHLLDSLAIVPPINAIFSQHAAKLLDVGSGAGLPGIPLAISNPTWDVTLLDKVAKKVAFLTQAKLELELDNVTCVHKRVEAFRADAFEIIVARAFASLSELVRVTRHLLRAGGWWAAMKGVHPDAELAELRRVQPDVRIVDAIKLAVPRLGAERHLILLQRP